MSYLGHLRGLILLQSIFSKFHSGFWSKVFSLRESIFLLALWSNADTSSCPFEVKNSFIESSTSSGLMKRREHRKRAMDRKKSINPIFIFIFYSNTTFEGYLMIHAFSKGISPKVNVIMWVEFELAYFEASFQNFSHYTSWTSVIIRRC